MKYDCREDIIQLTPLWEGARFPNGRPKVPDGVLRRIAGATVEEMWAPLYQRGYKFQFEGRFQRANPEKRVMVGRAVTAVFAPARPDLSDYLLEYGRGVEGRKGFFNQWPLEDLEEHDVVVFDLYGKYIEGNPIGGNLSTLIANKTKDGGAVVWGGVRDLDQIVTLPNTQTYYCTTDPTPLRDAMLLGINAPCRVGGAVCMPGDVVLGTPAGVIFIPAHLAEPCVAQAEKSHVRDLWGFLRIRDGKYTAAQMDSAWSLEMWEDFCAWFPGAEESTPYRHLDFEEELGQMRTRGCLSQDAAFGSAGEGSGEQTTRW